MEVRQRDTRRASPKIMPLLQKRSKRLCVGEASRYSNATINSRNSLVTDGGGSSSHGSLLKLEDAAANHSAQKWNRTSTVFSAATPAAWSIWTGFGRRSDKRQSLLRDHEPPQWRYSPINDF